MPNADEAAIEKAVATYRRRYKEEGMFDSALYPAVATTLEELKIAGYTMFIGTSKSVVFAKPLMEHFGLDHYFTGIYGAELDGKYDDKNILLSHIIAQEGIPKLESVMIGDRRYDIEAAKVNGIRSIGVLYGYGSREELEATGADLIIENFDELMQVITHYR